MIIAHERAFGKVLTKRFQQIRRFLVNSHRERRRVDEVERGLMEQMVKLSRHLLQTFVNRAGDGDVGKTVERDGQRLRRSKIQHQRLYRSIFGLLTVRRYVYRLREKQKVKASPVDERLGLPQGEESYVLQDWVGRLAVRMPYGEAVRSLEELLGTRTSARAAETMVRQMARPVQEYRRVRAAVPAQSEQPILVVTADAKGVPMRRPLEQRLQEELGKCPHKRSSRVPYEKAHKQRSRGDKKVRKQMAYVGGVYSIAPWQRTDQDVIDEIRRKALQKDRPRPQNKRLWAEMTQVLKKKEVSSGLRRLFGQLRGEVAARDPRHAKRLVLLMDGDRALWEARREYLPEAIGILDLYHVLTKLWKAAHCFHAETSAAAEAFVDRYLAMLLEGKVSNVIAVFRRFLAKCKTRKKKTLGRVICYFQTHREAMRYDQYLQAGYPIGSGVVEGACRHVVKDRLECTGMRWEIEGAQDVLQLRTTYLANEWSAFTKYRIQTEQTALYGRPA